MKKCKVLIYTLAVTFILSMFQQVNAALADNAIDAENTMLKPNEIVMRNNYDVNVPNLLPGEVGFCQGVANRGLEKDVNDDKDNVLRFRRYEMYDVTSSNASVTRRYGNIGYVNSGEYKGYTLGADMTISDLKMGNGSVNYDYSPTDRGADAGIGFNKYYQHFYVTTLKDIRIYNQNGELEKIFKKCVENENFENGVKIQNFLFELLILLLLTL